MLVEAQCFDEVIEDYGIYVNCITYVQVEITQYYVVGVVW